MDRKIHYAHDLTLDELIADLQAQRDDMGRGDATVSVGVYMTSEAYADDRTADSPPVEWVDFGRVGFNEPGFNSMPVLTVYIGHHVRNADGTLLRIPRGD